MVIEVIFINVATTIKIIRINNLGLWKQKKTLEILQIFGITEKYI